MTAAVALDHLSTLADSTRSRILLVLERHEMTVGELCAVLQLPQSTVSRHLKLLGDAGWLESRSEGTSRYYRIAAIADSWTERLWGVVRESVSTLSAAEQDRQREDAVLSARRSRSREFFASASGEWERVREELFGSRVDLQLTLAMLDPGWEVADLGCGTGHLAAQLAPHVRRVVAVDGSTEMLTAARERVAPFANVEVVLGDLERLPVPDDAVDLATLSLALHYVADPARALAEARRVLRRGGRLVVVDMMPHERDDLQQRMGHVWRGFSEEQVCEWLSQAGFSASRYRVLPPDEAARGPGLFVATALVH